MTPIPETSPMVERSNAVSAMCQQLSQGLSLLSSTDDPFPVDNKMDVCIVISQLFFPLEHKSFIFRLFLFFFVDDYV